MQKELPPLSVEKLDHIIQQHDVLKYHCESILIAPNFANLVTTEGKFSIIFWPSQSNSLGHWTAVTFNEGRYEYFDSLGETFETNSEFLDECKQRNKSVISSNIKFQCQSSNLCGYFTLFFVYYRTLFMLENYPIFLAKSFSLDCMHNENTVRAFYRKYYGNSVVSTIT